MMTRDRLERAKLRFAERLLVGEAFPRRRSEMLALRRNSPKMGRWNFVIGCVGFDRKRRGGGDFDGFDLGDYEVELR